MDFVPYSLLFSSNWSYFLFWSFLSKSFSVSSFYWDSAVGWYLTKSLSLFFALFSVYFYSCNSHTDYYCYFGPFFLDFPLLLFSWIFCSASFYDFLPYVNFSAIFLSTVDWGSYLFGWNLKFSHGLFISGSSLTSTFGDFTSLVISSPSPYLFSMGIEFSTYELESGSSPSSCLVEHVFINSSLGEPKEGLGGA